MDNRDGLCLGDGRDVRREFKKSPNLQNSKSPSNESNHSDNEGAVGVKCGECFLVMISEFFTLPSLYGMVVDRILDKGKDSNEKGCAISFVATGIQLSKSRLQGN